MEWRCIGGDGKPVTDKCFEVKVVDCSMDGRVRKERLSR